MGLGRDILYAGGLLITSPVWGLSLLRTGKWRTDWAGRFGRAAQRESPDEKRKTLLIHGVSVGEVGLIRNLVAELEQAPGLDLVITTTTNTGFARATALYADRHRVVRFPLDFTAAVRRFLDAVQPDAVALVELELWPNFMDACTARGVPVAVINGRLSARSFRRYRKVKRWVGSSFAKLAAAAVQNDDYAERFADMGVPRDKVHVLDTMKWDTAIVEDRVDGADQLAMELGIDRDRPLIVAGSTAPGEEKMLIETCPRDAQLLIAPRKPEWFDAVMKVAPDAVRRTVGRPAADGQRVFLLDTIGELRAAYSLADVCVVGRSFTGELYGSDMMEPIALGKPTVIGPYYADFADTMKALRDAGAIVVTEEPGDAAAELLNNPAVAGELAAAGRAVILSRQGATRRHAALLLELLDMEGAPEPVTQG
ncbi:MAG: glycosyltransferase N-terminal domain-containing protein [Planctomycetota bacterium]